MGWPTGGADGFPGRVFSIAGILRSANLAGSPNGSRLVPSLCSLALWGSCGLPKMLVPNWFPDLWFLALQNRCGMPKLMVPRWFPDVGFLALQNVCGMPKLLVPRWFPALSPYHALII